MSLPETCPFCGSGVDLRNGEKWVGYTCITTIHAGHDARRMQSVTCAGLERTRLLARVAELERDLEQAKADRARAAMDARNPLLEELAKLEARCKRLEEAGDVLQSAVVGVEGMTHWQWLAAAHEADLKWRAAKEAKP